MKCDALMKSKWYEVRQKGSRTILRHDENDETIVLPYHRGNEVPTAIANKILKQAGLK